MATAMETKTVEIDGKTHALKHADKDEPRTHDAWSVGDVAHQGDIQIVNIGTLPKSAKKARTQQVVEGDTQGSRHIVSGGKVFEVEAGEIVAAVEKACGVKIDAKYVGRVFEGPCVLTHPEHRHHEFPESVNAVIVQRNLDAEEREQRVCD